MVVCLRVRVWLLSCSFPLVLLIFLRYCLLHALHGFWIARGSFYLWILYSVDFILSIMGHHACSVFATSGM